MSEAVGHPLEDAAQQTDGVLHNSQPETLSPQQAFLAGTEAVHRLLAEGSTPSQTQSGWNHELGISVDAASPASNGGGWDHENGVPIGGDDGCIDVGDH